ncbi:MAG: sugar phosphate isomerase/epimerase family protein [Candidatus Limnocylindrales bacterium]
MVNRLTQPSGTGYRRVWPTGRRQRRAYVSPGMVAYASPGMSEERDMRFGVLGVIWSDWTDVTYESAAFARELGFRGMGAHLTVPASTISPEVAANVRDCIAGNGLDFLQLWGPYPTIISEDETVRRAGVAGAADIVRLAARLGVPEAGVRPTSHNPRGDWWPHPENHSQASEDRLVRSISEILETAVVEDVDIVLEVHATSTLDTVERVERVIRRTDPRRVRVNIDTVNFVRDLPTAFDPTPMIEHFFDVLGPHCATVQVKDFYLEERFVVHISETIPGTGLMDLDTVLRRTAGLGPDTWAVIEHLPLGQIALAKRNLTARAAALGLEVR